MDLVVRNVRLRGVDEPCDIGIVDEAITRIETQIAEAGEREIDGDGGLAVPSFVDSHSHLDKSMMIYQSPPAVTGTITESLARSYTDQAVGGRRNADRRYVIRLGRLVSETTTETTLHFDVGDV